MNIGDVLDDKYRIEGELGRGSFGAVYKAVQVTIDRTVAIKLLTPKGKLDEEMRRRFKREAKLSSHLNSPHSIKIHDFGETPENQMFIVMEYLQGQPLDLLVRESGPLGVERTKRIVLQVLDSLGEAHRLGIIHRDLKPDNIFVCNNATQTDFVKVFDFGIAKVIGGGSSGSLKETAKLTMVGGTVGTPAYMSPEQCCGEDLTPASDFYSLGIVMYEMLTSLLPFEDTNPVRTMMRQINEMPDPLPDDIANTSVGRAVNLALQKKPDDRFQSAEDFINALQEPDPTATPEPPTIQIPEYVPPEATVDAGTSGGYDTQPTEKTAPARGGTVSTNVAKPAGPPSSMTTKLLWAVVIGGIVIVAILLTVLVVLYATKQV